MTYDRTMLIGSNQIMNFGLRPQIRHRGTGISTKGVVVKTEHLLDMFGSNEEKFSHDCFLVLPSELLGEFSSYFLSLPDYIYPLFELALENLKKNELIVLSFIINGIEMGLFVIIY